MNLSLNKTDKLFLISKYKSQKLNFDQIDKKIKEINKNTHELVIKSNKKKRSKEEIRNKILEEINRL